MITSSHIIALGYDSVQIGIIMQKLKKLGVPHKVVQIRGTYVKRGKVCSSRYKTDRESIKYNSTNTQCDKGNKMISEELLSEVLGLKVIGNLKFSDNVLYVDVDLCTPTTRTIGINIYELAHKCKEWAFNNHDFILQSVYIPKGIFTSSYCVAERNFSYQKYDQTFHADTEHEAIFKSCQWILDNKEQK